MSGRLNFEFNQHYCPNSPGRPSLPPTVGPAGFDLDVRKPWGVRVGIGTQTTAPSSTLSLQPTTESAPEISGFVQGPGVLWVKRPIDPLYWSCSENGGESRPGWFVSGSQTIQAIELAPPDVVPDKNPVSPGDTVRFDLHVSWSTNFFIGSGTGWRWVPDTTTNTSTLLSCSRLQNFCKVIVRERGHVEVQNVVVEGGLTFNPRSPIVEVASSRVRIQSQSGVLAVGPSAMKGQPDSLLVLAISVESNSGPIANSVVDLTIDGIEGTGGHQHGVTMPPGALSSLSVNTGPTGVANVTYTSGAFGGNIDIRGTSTGAASARETIVIRVPGLSELMEAGNVDTIGWTTLHPSNHWGTPAMLSGLTALADAYFAFTGNTSKLQFNDMSVVFGGKFDVNPADYSTTAEHDEHRLGKSADIRSKTLTAAQYEWVRRWWLNEYGALGVLEHKGTNAHFHLRVGCTVKPCY